MQRGWLGPSWSSCGRYRHSLEILHTKQLHCTSISHLCLLHVLSWRLFQQYCRDAFRGAFSSSTPEYQARIDATSQKLLGWNTTAERLFVVNGNRASPFPYFLDTLADTTLKRIIGDPWVEVTHSAAAARIASTATQPIFLTDGFHCSDLIVDNAIDQSINQVFQSAITTFPQWVAEFKPSDTPTTTTTTGSGSDSNKNGSLGRREAATSALGLVLAGVVFTFMGL